MPDSLPGVRRSCYQHKDQQCLALQQRDDSQPTYTSGVQLLPWLLCAIRYHTGTCIRLMGVWWPWPIIHGCMLPVIASRKMHLLLSLLLCWAWLQVEYVTIAGKFVEGVDPVKGQGTALARFAGAGYQQVGRGSLVLPTTMWHCVPANMLVHACCSSAPRCLPMSLDPSDDVLLCTSAVYKYQGGSLGRLVPCCTCIVSACACSCSCHVSTGMRAA
jgi:hypothetical protein